MPITVEIKSSWAVISFMFHCFDSIITVVSFISDFDIFKDNNIENGELYERYL